MGQRLQALKKCVDTDKQKKYNICVMDRSEEKKRRDRKNAVRLLSMVSQFAIMMLVPIVGCFFAGLWLDRHFGTQWCAIVLFFIGALAGFTNIYKLTKEYTANHEDRKSPEGEVGAAQGSGGAVHRDSGSRDTDTGGSSDIL